MGEGVLISDLPREGKPDVPTTESFVEFVKAQEGFRPSPYPDGKGADRGFSIGHGRFRKGGTLTEASKFFGAPWSEDRADTALRQDISSHFVKAAKFVSKEHGDDAWNSLAPFAQEALTDFAITPGITKFPKLTEAIVGGDRLRIAKEYKRYSGGEELGRNKAWWAKYGKKLTSGITYRNIEPTSKFVDFLDSIGVYSGDL